MLRKIVGPSNVGVSGQSGHSEGSLQFIQVVIVLRSNWPRWDGRVEFRIMNFDVYVRAEVARNVDVEAVESTTIRTSRRRWEGFLREETVLPMTNCFPKGNAFRLISLVYIFIHRRRPAERGRCRG